jgi:hypothetical protein
VRRSDHDFGELVTSIRCIFKQNLETTLKNPDAFASGDAQHEQQTTKYTLITNAANTNAAKFSLEQVVVTPGALALMEHTNTNPAVLLSRHIHGDWGDVCVEDRTLNDQALIDGSRLMSVYRLVTPEKLAATAIKNRAVLPTVWIITETVSDDGKRASTCLLLPEDY